MFITLSVSIGDDKAPEVAEKMHRMALGFAMDGTYTSISFSQSEEEEEDHEVNLRD